MKKAIFIVSVVFFLTGCKKEKIEPVENLTAENTNQQASNFFYPKKLEVFWDSANGSSIVQSTVNYTYDIKMNPTEIIRINKYYYASAINHLSYDTTKQTKSYTYSGDTITEILTSKPYSAYRKWGTENMIESFKYKNGNIKEYKIESVFLYTEGCGQVFCSPTPDLKMTTKKTFTFIYSDSGTMKKTLIFDYTKDAQNIEYQSSDSIMIESTSNSIILKQNNRATRTKTYSSSMLNTVDSRGSIQTTYFDKKSSIPDNIWPTSISDNYSNIDNEATILHFLEPTKDDYLKNLVLSISDNTTYGTHNYNYLTDNQDRVVKIEDGKTRTFLEY